MVEVPMGDPDLLAALILQFGPDAVARTRPRCATKSSGGWRRSLPEGRRASPPRTADRLGRMLVIVPYLVAPGHVPGRRGATLRREA